MQEQTQERQSAVEKAVLSILTGARKLIRAPEGWTQGTGGRNRLGAERHHDEPDVVSFCSVGAIYRAAGVRRSKGGDEFIGGDAPQVKMACARVADALAGDGETYGIDEGMSGLLLMNDIDDTTHAQVLEAFNEAVRLSGGEVEA